MWTVDERTPSEILGMTFPPSYCGNGVPWRGELPMFLTNVTPLGRSVRSPAAAVAWRVFHSHAESPALCRDALSTIAGCVCTATSKCRQAVALGPWTTASRFASGRAQAPPKESASPAAHGHQLSRKGLLRHFSTGSKGAGGGGHWPRGAGTRSGGGASPAAERLQWEVSATRVQRSTLF